MLTDAQRAAGIAHLEDEVARARAAVEAADFHFWESDAKNSQLGAIRIVADTTLPALRRLAAQGSDDADVRFAAIAHTAEDSLAAMRGYTASATFDSVLEATAAQTAQDTGELANKASQVASRVAGAGLSALWSAIPLAVKLGAGLALAGVVYVYARPLLPRRAAA